MTLNVRIEHNEARLYEIQERSAIAESDAEAAALDPWFEPLEQSEPAAEPTLVEFFGVFALALVAAAEFVVGIAAIALIAARTGYRAATGMLSRETEPVTTLIVTTA